MKNFQTFERFTFQTKQKKNKPYKCMKLFYQGYFFSALLATFNCGFYFLSEDRAKSSQFKTKHDVSLFEF